VPDPIAAIREAARVLRRGERATEFEKFLPDGAGPSALRRAAAAVARRLATDLNRQLGLLLRASGLREVHREPAGLGGAFVVALGER
jgi:hypothetical protein